MPENILVVEYEPRYTDRVRQALTGQTLAAVFAKDGEEALRALEGELPKLIVLSSVVPKISTSELIRAIRGRKPLAETPILLTVSGYNGKSPKADAQRMGASDILPKPYSEGEFLGKIQQMLGLPASAAPFDADFTVRAAPDGLTSNDIFGELVDDDKPKKAGRASGNVDQMLADTLAGVMPQKKKDTGAVPVAPAKPKTQPGSGSDYDKILSDTLSGLEKNARKTTSGGNVPVPTPTPTPTPTPAPRAPEPVSPRFNTEKLQAVEADRVPVSQPVFPAAVPAAKHEEDEPADGVKFGQYVLVEKIATGGMAEVWKARMRGVEGFQKIVAIKKILPHLSDNQDFIEMFIDEAKLAAQLNHNNIIHIYDLGKIQSSYYIAMEYIDGFDLKTILRRGQERDTPMTVELALFIASKIASALDYAHRKRDFEEKDMGIVHRDVSPQNVLISQEGDIKLCDFGIAKAASKASHTQAGALKGKLQYMSPEQAWGRAIDRRSDVFALATVLFELLTARKLFTGDNELSILEQVREARVQPPSLYNDEVTPEVDKIVLKALQKDPANRYQSAGEMARDLDAVLYSFRPTPTSADLAIFMHRLSSAEPIPEPVHEEPEPVRPQPPRPMPPPQVPPVPVPVPVAVAPAPMMAPVAAPVAETPDYGAIPEPVKRKSAAPLIGMAAGLIAVALGAWVVFGRKGDAPAPAAPTTSAATLATPGAVSTAPLTPATTTAPTTAAATSTAPVIDPSLVDQEVAKRLAAERARLEAAARAQQPATATTATQAPARVVPPPVTATVAQQPAPQPVETRPAPEPEPVRPAPTPAETPQQSAPAQARAKEGDLVPVGTDGLNMPRMLRRASVPYPAVARMQKIQGTVITTVLVSESGSVLDVKVIRGINRPVGLNEAAEQMMRRSTFAPATKDGVRVKTWMTVPVEFKL